MEPTGVGPLKSQIVTYSVTAEYKVIRYGDTRDAGYSYIIQAKNKADAIKDARKRVWLDGHTRQDGTLIFTATFLSHYPVTDDTD
jgi:hypothetical protein